MSVSLRDHHRPAWTSGLARHANPAADRTPSARTAFRVTFALILLAAALHHWLLTLAGWVFLGFVIAALYAADLIGIQ